MMPVKTGKRKKTSVLDEHSFPRGVKKNKTLTILLTGANGYIGKRLLPVLLEAGHHVICCVRDKGRFQLQQAHPRLSIWEHDFLEPLSGPFQQDIDAAYYLIHSMSTSISDFYGHEARSASNFVEYINQTNARQIIYLSGITNQEKLSRHLASRKNVEVLLSGAKVPLTTLKAGIIVGSGSSSFEIMRDLVEKLPVMVAPRWIETHSQPIAIRNVIEYLLSVLFLEQAYGRSLDIGGPEVLSYKQMLLRFARVRKLKRFIWTLPVMTPRLSSYWLYFVTSVSYNLAVNLVNSMKIEVIADDRPIREMTQVKLIGFDEAVKNSFDKLESDNILSSWKDSFISSLETNNLTQSLSVPSRGCLTDRRQVFLKTDPQTVLERIWSIGGDNGWYYANRLWKIRGFIDKLAGGTGLRRGRTHQHTLNVGDALDFWRVLIADRQAKRLLLYAEMKLPGEAWLEFRLVRENNQHILHQTATFRPHGLSGRIYWYSLLPLHLLIFRGMSRRLATGSS
jgi:uncharacterized protein YbjT (DUF2867 family)